MFEKNRVGKKKEMIKDTINQRWTNAQSKLFSRCSVIVKGKLRRKRYYNKKITKR